MSVSIESGGNSQDFDINLAPIIDCFTVLIAFMLVSASFLALAVLDAGVAATAGAGNDQKPPSIRIDVELTMKNEVVFRVEGKLKLNKKFPPKGEAYDQDSVIAQVRELRKRFPDTQGLVLSAADDVEYQHVVAMMEGLRKHIPSVLLGGL